MGIEIDAADCRPLRLGEHGTPPLVPKNALVSKNLRLPGPMNKVSTCSLAEPLLHRFGCKLEFITQWDAKKASHHRPNMAAVTLCAGYNLQVFAANKTQCGLGFTFD